MKSPKVYIIKFSALFVVHTFELRNTKCFELRNTKCFTNCTQFIIAPLLGGLPRDCLYYISRAFLRIKKKKGKLRKLNEHNFFLKNFLQDLFNQCFTELLQLLVC